MRVNTFYGACSLALLLLATTTGCQKSSRGDEPIVTSTRETTYAYLTVKQAPHTSAFGDDAATDSEVNIINGSLYGEKNDNAKRALNFTKDEALRSFVTEPWLTQPGERSLALTVNDQKAPNFNLEQLDKDSDARLESIDQVLITDGDAKDISKVKALFMYALENVKSNVVIIDNISKEQAKQGNEQQNHFRFTLQRPVAKSMVFISATNIGTTEAPAYRVENTNKEKVGTLNNVYFGVGGSSVKTPLNEKRVVSTDDMGVVRLGDDPNNTKAGEGKSFYAPRPIAKDADEAINNPIYFFEKIVKPEGEVEGFTWGNTAYNKVYATFVPDIVYKLDDKGQPVKDESYKPGTTFFVGQSTRKYYSTIEAALADGNVKAWKYEDAKTVYLLPINNDPAVEARTHNTHRNNAYISEISKITGIGLNYDPNDPNDPNIPKPNNPDEPSTPINPKGPDDPIDGEKLTYMSVTSSIINWGVVNKDSNLVVF